MLSLFNKCPILSDGGAQCFLWESIKSLENCSKNIFKKKKKKFKVCINHSVVLETNFFRKKNVFGKV